MSESNANGWTTPADIKALLRRRWQRGEILASSLTQDPLFPLRFSIKGPSSAQISADFGAARDWIAEWGNQKIIPIEWRNFSHRLFGDNQMPSAAIIPAAESAVRILGTRREWETHQEMIAQCRDSFPELLDWLAKRTITALELAPDWQAVLAVVAWVRDHPRSGLFLRQMDAPGVHTKLVEKYRGVISELLERVLPADAIDASARGTSGFARRYGFRDKPERIRVRFLDPACAIAPERLGLDLTLDSAAFAVLDPLVERVFITENEVNFLAFPNCPRSLVIFGSGYGWSALAAASWLHQRAIHYWGDIDTHGFAILDQLRSGLPHVRSMLMNREVLLHHRDFWTTDDAVPQGYVHLVDLCRRGMLYEAEAWLAAGHSPARPPGAHTCPLQIATEKGFHSMVKLLLRHGCTSEQMADALEEAAKVGNMELCQLLVEAGAPVGELPYWCLDEIVNRPLIQYLLDHGLDLTRENGLARMLIYRRIKPLLGLYLQNRKRFPEWEDQAAIALCEFVRKRDLKWISLMIWAKADPLRKVLQLSDRFGGYLDDVKECAAEIAVHLGDTEIFSMLKIAPTKEQADELMQSVWFDAGRPMIERLVQAGADLNAYEPESGTPLHRMLRSFGWNCDGRFSRRDLKEDVEMIAWMLRLGAKWIPPENDREPDSLRRHFYRGEPKLVVEVIRLLDVANACEKSLLRELIDKPKMRAWVGFHEAELRDRLLAR